LKANRDEYERYAFHDRCKLLPFAKTLTERLLQVAREHNYVLEFDHAAIRYRIRSYYRRCREKEERLIMERNFQFPKRSESRSVVEESEPMTMESKKDVVEASEPMMNE
jgi:hypothetical protein